MPARLVPFLDAACADRHAAADLYVWNARLSSVCREVIHHVEVLVRSAIPSGTTSCGSPSLHHAFPHGSGTRRGVAGQLNRISQLRNDIAHHQPIIDIPVTDRHQDMLNLARAIDPAAAAWIGTLSRVEETLAARPAERMSL
jgi:hypothetical protein